MACSLPVPAGAQAETADVPDEARLLFERARVASEEGRSQEAQVLLERSLSLSPRLSTAANLAIEYGRTERYAQARALWLRIQRGDFGAVPAELERTVRQELLAVERLCPRLELRLRAPPGRARVELGPHSFEIDASEQAVRWLNPGSYRVRVQADAFVDLERVVQLEAGAVQGLDLRLEPIAEPIDWPLVVVLSSGAVAVVVAVVLTAILLSQPQPVESPPWGRVEI